MAVDAFTEDWDRFSLSYIFPHPPMVELILNRIYQCSMESKFILITPWRMSAVWFPKALKLATQPPVRLPVSWKTVVELGQSGDPPTTKRGSKTRFVAWKLSGWGGHKLENCLLGLSLLYSRAGRRTQRSVMDWGSDIGPSTAGGISWTSLPRLL